MIRSLSVLALCAALPFAAGAEELALVGAWTLNVERTQAIAPDNSTSRWWEGLGGNFSTSVSVGGIPVPTGSPGPAPELGTPGPPQMLRCQAFTIKKLDDGLLITYQGVGSEELRPGAYRGMRSQWSRRKLTSNYESTTRKVKRSLEVGRDGRLLMSVTINPRKGKTLRYKRVFDRA
ncbi:MAG: hypothetical protein F4220_04745 [Gammaproteobacteria bacterium]|nr:hypothetical protein [Gammaproteobacteria bacterium]MYF49443.1 hypothetical protein [Gammaproteobacteria bacterium]